MEDIPISLKHLTISKKKLTLIVIDEMHTTGYVINLRNFISIDNLHPEFL